MDGLKNSSKVFVFNFHKEKICFEIEKKNKRIKIITSYGNTVVLTTLVVDNNFRKKKDKFILQVNFEERGYSVNKIPNTPNKRENNRNNELNIISRMIDRPLRSFFSSYYNDSKNNEIVIDFKSVQINNYVLSSDENDPTIIAMWNSSLCCFLSDDLYFFDRPISSFKVNKINNNRFFNKIVKEDFFLLEIILSSSNKKIISLDIVSDEIDEEEIEEELVILLSKNNELEKFFFEIKNYFLANEARLLIREEKIKKKNIINTHEIKKINKELENILKRNVSWEEKEEELVIFADEKKNEIWQSLLDVNKKTIDNSSFSLESELLRILEISSKEKIREEIKEKIDQSLINEIKLLSSKGSRIDGRKFNQIREIDVILNPIPMKNNKNVLFSRGKTKTLTVITLGNEKNRQVGKEEKFIHHYNFLPYSSGEISHFQNSSRREIGHGKLIEKTFYYLLSKIENFKHIIRAVSEVISSDGSTSQASICSTSIALFLSNIPIESLAAGISFGLINNELIYDINALEDRLGEMDFKIAGTKKGICSTQLDVKNSGIELDKIVYCLKESRKIHSFIIDKMKEKISHQ